MTERPARSRRKQIEADQLALDLALAPRYGGEDFLVGPSNEQAHGLIEAWPDWHDPVILIEGPRGSGKTHLAAIWAERAHAWTVDAAQISMARVPYLVSNRALVIEDADRGPRDEAALFHLLNLAREQGTSVLITASTPPSAWGLATPDLLSRLRLAPGARIAPPDEALLKAVLVKLFVDRQLLVDTRVVDALALRIDRSLAEAGRVVAALDQEALRRGRRLTRNLALEILASMPEIRDDDGPEPGDEDGDAVSSGGDSGA
jgi:chromosomal replication initiation ATPase DnaA